MSTREDKMVSGQIGVGEGMTDYEIAQAVHKGALKMGTVPTTETLEDEEDRTRKRIERATQETEETVDAMGKAHPSRPRPRGRGWGG